MELKEFVRESLLQIIGAVREAQAQCADAEINPIVLDSHGGRRQSARGNDVQDVQFDVAVTATDAGEKKAGIGIVAAIGIGASLQSATTNESVSRIKFAVTIALPSGDAGARNEPGR